MKTTARTFLSSITGLGLAVFTIASVLFAGLAAYTTVLGFSFLALFGMAEIAILSYRTPATVFGGRPPRPAPAHSANVVVFPRQSALRKAA